MTDQPPATRFLLPTRRAPVRPCLCASGTIPFVARQLLLLLMAIAVTSCELEEIPVDEGDPITVVHAVMRPDRNQQWVLVETSLTGAREQLGEAGVPGGVGRPVVNAFVTVTNTTFADDPCGPEVTFDADPVDTTDQTAGVYWSPLGCPTMRPGDTLHLRVETPDGTVVMGATEVPGISSATLSAGGVEEMMPGPLFTFNRDVDTLVAEVDPIRGRALQIEIGERPSLYPSWVFADSSAITLPGTVPNFFISDFEFDDEPPDLFVPGVYYEFTTAWTDQNYFDFVRSMNSPLSGRGFINNLEGGMGLFGSLVAVTNDLRVVGNADDPAEGRYQLSGVIDGVAVDIIWELYTNPSSFANLTGFVSGTWYYGPLDNYVTGRVEETNRFDARLFQDPGEGDEDSYGTFVLHGQLDTTGGTFPVTVFLEEAYTIQGRRITP